MYKKFLKDKGFDIENLPADEKIQYNQIIQLEQKLRLSVANEIEDGEIHELTLKINTLKDNFETSIFKPKETEEEAEKEKTQHEDPKPEEPVSKSGGFFAALAVIGTIAIGALFIISGSKPTNLNE